jgi:hypothetical protein
MSSNSKCHVLVTGTHRSGTTWVGKVLATAPETVYVHEPFNVDHPNPSVPVRMRYWYQWIHNGAEPANREVFRDLLASHDQCEPTDPRTSHSVARFVNDFGTWFRGRSQNRPGRRVILKDPFALFSAAWLAENFNFIPVICIRHPAAFVSSLRLRGWRFDLRNLIDQPGLVQEFLPEEQPRFDELIDGRTLDPISEGAYLWYFLHRAILKLRREHPSWVYVRHEDLSRNPVEHFRYLCANLGLPYTANTDAYLKSTIVSPNQEYVLSSTDPHNVIRDSFSNALVWKKRLSEHETALIREIVDEVAVMFYSEAEW